MAQQPRNIVLPLNIVDIHNRLLTLESIIIDGVETPTYTVVDNIPPLRYTDVNSSKLAITTDGELFNLAKRMICTLVDSNVMCYLLEIDFIPRFERVIDMPGDAVLVITEPRPDRQRLIIQIDNCSVVDQLYQYQWYNLGTFKDTLMTSINDTICNDHIPKEMRINVDKIRTDLVFTNESIFSANGDYWKHNPLCARDEVIDMIAYSYVNDTIRRTGALALMNDGIIRYDLDIRERSINSLSYWRGRLITVVENPERWRFIELGRQRALANSVTGEVRLLDGSPIMLELLNLPFDSFKLVSSRSKSARNIAL